MWGTVSQAECSRILVEPKDGRKDCAPAVLLERQVSPNVVVFL